MSRRDRPFLDFTDRDGRPAGRAPMSESGARSNLHFGRTKNPTGPLCNQPLTYADDTGFPTSFCAEPFKPICPNLRCPGSRVPRAMMRLERIDHGSIVSDEARENHAKLSRQAAEPPKRQKTRRPKPVTQRVKVEAAPPKPEQARRRRRPRTRVASDAHLHALQRRMEARR